MCDKKLEKRIVEFSFFYGVVFSWILGNDKGVGVFVFKNYKIKIIDKWNILEWFWVKGKYCFSLVRFIIGFFFIIVYSFSRNFKD